ncbi:MAG: RNA polymerase sigma factor SigJ [Verrucomicrobiota bacterium]
MLSAPASLSMKPADIHLERFEEHRSRLKGIAYRMLGSVSDAEDMVQEAWLRWSRSDVDGIGNPGSWLTTVVSRLCLDRLKSARARREEYYGTWLPEPFVDTSAPDPVTAQAEVDESVSIALMLMLEKLSPAERAGFLLHDVFGHTFQEIAGILDRPEVNCRKLVSRARERVRAGRPRFTASRAEHEDLLRRFLEASRAGEMEPLMTLLGTDAALYSDGGGKVSALPEVLADRGKIAAFFITISREDGPTQGFRAIRPAWFNGAPGVLLYLDGQLVTALTLEIAEGRIEKIFAHRNPDKLRWLAGV